MKIHELKIENAFFQSIYEGSKKAEIRINDRDYQVGDIIEIGGEVDHIWYDMKLEITHVLSGWGLKENYVMLSFGILESVSEYQ